MTIETPNLRLRPFTSDDTTFIIELLNSKGWLEFIGDRNVRSAEDAVNYLEKGPLKSYADNGFGLSMVELKNGGLPVGMCGLIKREGLEDIDLGFAFLPGHSGKGYATEISKAVLNHAFLHLNIPKVVAITNPENADSIKVLKKTGMVEVGRVILPNETKELLHFAISNPRSTRTF